MSDRDNNQFEARRKDLVAQLQTGPMVELARLQQMLKTLSKSESTAPEELRSRLNELGYLAEGIACDISDAIQAVPVSPDSGDRNEPGADLYSRLHREFAVFAAASDLRCEFHVEPEHVNFNSLVGEVVLRSIRELLANVDRHAQAQAVMVSSSIGDDGSLVFEVEDDGVGMSGMTPAAVNSNEVGFGLWNIDLCLREFGGFLEFSGELGLTVRIVLPGQHITI